MRMASSRCPPTARSGRYQTSSSHPTTERRRRTPRSAGWTFSSTTSSASSPVDPCATSSTSQQATEGAIGMMARQDALPRADALTGRRTAAALTSTRRWALIAPWLFLLPWLVGLLAITLGPMLASLYLSFTDYNLLGKMDWVGVDNYVRMFSDDPKFFSALTVT